MRLRNIFFGSLLFLSLFSFLAPNSFAAAIQKPVISVINPLREPNMTPGSYSLTSLKEQWEVTHNYNIKATWLWQYQTLQDNALVDYAKSEMEGQEFGLFLEIDRSLAAKAHVLYRGQGPWYFSDGLLLVSYDTKEQQKLIDTAFSAFKQKFGYYPKTVGAWWIGQDALNYMQKKYGIVAALRAADQYDLDAYSIWGTPWSIPYVSSSTNEGIPAAPGNSSHVVILQWAARDPIRAYGTTFAASTFSIQDYALKGYDISYFDYLSGIFLKKPLDQMVIGLEGGNPAGAYETQYKEQLSRAVQWQKEGKIAILPADEYASSFLASGKTLAPTHYFLTDDFTSQDQSFWYNASYYRAGIEKQGDKVYLVDLRNYAPAPTEDFSLLPNSQGFLRINEPSLIDSARMPGQRQLLAMVQKPLQTAITGDTVHLFAGDTEVAMFTPTRFTAFRNGKVFLVQDFSSQNYGVNIFTLILVLFVCYLVVVYLSTKHIHTTLLHGILLLVPIVFAYPFLENGNIQHLSFVFDKKELILLTLPFLLKMPLVWHLIFIEVLPFVLLFLGHYMLTLRLHKRVTIGIFVALYAAILLLFSHVFYFPLDRSTYKTLLLVLGALSLLFLAISVYVFYKTKKLRTLFSSLVVSGLLLGGVVVTIIFSRQQYVLTSFEINALSYVSEQEGSIYYVLPSSSLIYKAVRPLLYDNPRLVESVVGHNWGQLTEVGDTVLNMQTIGQGFLFVPKYLGASISNTQIGKYHLRKVFDNAQIVIYKK